MQKKNGLVYSYQALRALAVCMVVGNHVAPRVFPGGFIGVDVFFVISGYLITSHLAKELERGQIDFLRFYLRRARRLLPAALLVLAVTAVGTWLILPAGKQSSFFRDIAAAAGYVLNWWLAFHSVDYFSEKGLNSPVNHYWSLSVEEQFYIIWPALMLVSVRFAMWLMRRPADAVLPKAVGATLLLIWVASLAIAVTSIRHDKAATYFFTHARAWEFASGGLVSIFTSANERRLPAAWGISISMLAWGVLLASVWLLNPQSQVPGLEAVPPVLATAALMALGDSYLSHRRRMVITAPPIQRLGDISYSFYLWHWPVIIFAPFVVKMAPLGAIAPVSVVIVSIALALLTKTFVEDSFRFRPIAMASFAPQWRSAIPLVGYLALSATACGVSVVVAQALDDRSTLVARELYSLSRAPAPCFGGRSEEAGADCPTSHYLADANFALQSWKTQLPEWTNLKMPEGVKSCQNAHGDARVLDCAFGVPEGKERQRIALLGDSHAGMWGSALAALAEPFGFRINVYIAGNCAATAEHRSFSVYLPPEFRDACVKWRMAAVDAIIANEAITTVFTSANASAQKLLTKNAEWSEDDGSGFAEVWRRLHAAGKRVVVIDDVPALPFMLPDCLAKDSSRIDPCTVPRSEIAESTPLSRAKALLKPGEVDFISFKNIFCDEKLCHTVIGGIPAYMDSDHISAPMARSLVKPIAKLLDPRVAIGW